MPKKKQEEKKEEVKSVSGKTETSQTHEKLRDLADKAKTELEKILKIIGKEADLSSKFMKSKVQVLGLNNDLEKKYRELGKETYNLVSENKITDSNLKKICDEIDGLYKEVDQRKEQIDDYKVQMKKVPNSK